MRISIVVPVHDNAGDLGECLDVLVPAAGPDAEIVVVDDGSTDGSAAVATRAGVRCVRLPRNAGPAVARNRGAHEATGDVLLFVDSDVVVAPDTVRRIGHLLEERPDLAAVFGSYDAAPRAPGLVSQFRNLLHHFVHQLGSADASTFWAGCGAVRRAAFEAVGGFDERPQLRAIEDIELGYRLRSAGHRIHLDRDLRVTHLKRWTIVSMVRTDVFYRAVPWSRLLLERGTPLDHLNLTTEHRVSVGAASLVAAGIAAAAVRPEVLAVAVVAGACLLLANRRLLAFLARVRGVGFALAAIPLLFLHYLGSALAYGYVRGRRALARVGAA